MEISIGGPPLATLTCCATVAVAYYAALGAEAALGKVKGVLTARRHAPVH
jgi:hypothetical protein